MMQSLILFVKDKRIDLASKGFCIKERPHIPTTKARVESIDVQGRDGSLHIDKGYEDIDISVELNILDDKMQSRIREVKGLIFDCDKILFSDDEHFCYIVNSVTIGDIENEVNYYGSFEVTFNCRPFSYKVSTFEYKTISNSLFVEGYKAAPLFKITKTGEYFKFAIDDNIIGVNTSARVVYIDFDNLTCYSEGINLLDKMTGEFTELFNGNHTILNKSNVEKIEVMTREGWR
ncbi:phage tail component protein [Peptostreptococcus anaerobius]|uniref:Phage tail component protein n=2 Tax=Peptostreptococcus anaerobius TaxID=1261 RepID=A0A135YZ70_9FIRM|nr:phage tail component protein [Peptostreptococcus anaerobius]